MLKQDAYLEACKLRDKLLAARHLKHQDFMYIKKLKRASMNKMLSWWYEGIR